MFLLFLLLLLFFFFYSFFSSSSSFLFFSLLRTTSPDGAMNRSVRSRLKVGGGVGAAVVDAQRRESYFVVVTVTSLVLYVICLYTFLHVNGYIGAKDAPAVSAAAFSAAAAHAADGAAAAPPSGNHNNNDGVVVVRRESSFVRSHVQFDDGKIHEFTRNVGQPVDWDMRVKGASLKVAPFQVALPDGSGKRPPRRRWLLTMDESRSVAGP